MRWNMLLFIGFFITVNDTWTGATRIVIVLENARPFVLINIVDLFAVEASLVVLARLVVKIFLVDGWRI